MNILRESGYSSILFYPEEKILEQRWKPVNISQEYWKQEMLAYVDKAQTVRAYKALVNAQNFDFPIIPELQQWAMGQVFKPLTELGLKKMAFVVSSDLFTQTSIENIAEEAPAGSMEIRFFDSYDDARHWFAQ